MQTAWQLLLTDGPLSVLKELLAKVGTLETYLAYRMDLEGLPSAAPIDLPLVVRRARGDDFQRFQRMPPPFPRHAEFYFKFGLDRCFLGISADEIAHIAWIYYPQERRNQPTRFRRLEKDEAAIANCVTLPKYRGRGVYPAVLHVLLAQLKSEGYRRCYMYIEEENVASQRGVAKAGFRPVGKSWRLRLFFHRDPAAGFYFEGKCA